MDAAAVAAAPAAAAAEADANAAPSVDRRIQLLRELRAAAKKEMRATSKALKAD